MSPSKKETETVEAESVGTTPDDGGVVVEPKTGTPSPEQIKAERDRTENISHPQIPEGVNTEGELVSHDDRPPADVQIDDMRAMIPPPSTSSYVTFPDYLRDETENDRADLHRSEIFDDAGNRIGEKGHWVQVVQVRTFDDGRVPQVSLRCECNREYVLDWTGDLAEKVVKVSRT